MGRRSVLLLRRTSPRRRAAATFGAGGRAEVGVIPFLEGWRRPICVQVVSPTRFCGKPASYVYRNGGHAPDWTLCEDCRAALVADIEQRLCPDHVRAVLGQIEPLH